MLGGGGAFAAVGARIATLTEHPERIGWFVHAGWDMPEEMRTQIDSWETNCRFLETPERRTTRGLNVYDEFGTRRMLSHPLKPSVYSSQDILDFSYTTPKARIDESYLSDEHLKSKAFHLICSPKRCIDLVKGIKKRFTDHKLSYDPKKMPVSDDPREFCGCFVWEPIPDSMKPSEYDSFIEALDYVQVVSPNHLELCQLNGIHPSDADDAFSQIVGPRMREWLQKDISNTIVLREGEKGCSVLNGDIATFMSPYHTSPPSGNTIDEPDKVVDATGAGNAFLGAFCSCLFIPPDQEDLSPLLDLSVEREKAILSLRSNKVSRMEFAALWGTIAASFVVEQSGMPKLTREEAEDDVDEYVFERWNGETAYERFDAYVRDRVFRHYIIPNASARPTDSPIRKEDTMPGA